MGPENWFYSLPLRLRSLFRRNQVEQELDEELQYHLDQQTAQFASRGLTSEEARYAALRGMQGLAQRKEECRDTRGFNAIDNTLRDIRYSLRVIAKSPGFTAVAIITLALAVGANAVVVGLLNGLVLHPLHVPAAESLYGIVYGDASPWHSYPNYVDLRARTHSFDDLAAFNFAFVGLDSGSETTPANGFAVSGNYFDELRVKPYLGRFFSTSDERGPNSAPYIVLSYNYWQSHFLADPQIIGRKVRLNKHPFTIVGVAPRGFTGTLAFVSPDLFLPIVNQQQVNGAFDLNTRSDNAGIFEAFGHLKPGVTPVQAIAEMESVAAYLRTAYPLESSHRATTLSRTGFTAFGSAVRAFVGGLMALAGLILLAACANLGSLFAARASDRSREVALRLALGSSGTRVIRQLLTEALIVALAGGAIGLTCSIYLLNELSVWQPFAGTPIHIPVAPDSKVYFVALALAILCGFLFGIVPLRQVLRTDPYQVVKAGSRTTDGRRLAFRDLLLVAQIAICAVLVTASLVAVRGLVRSVSAHYGFITDNALLSNVNLSMAGYRIDQSLDMQKRAMDAMQTIPGVRSVGFVNDFPPLIDAAGKTSDIFKDETRDFVKANVAAVPYRYEVSPGYFVAAGTNLLAGRAFTAHDDAHASRVAIVNRTLATTLFGSFLNALDKFYRLQDGTRVQIIGVAEDGKYLSLAESQQPAMFLSALQWPATQGYLVLRHSAGTPETVSAAVRRQIRQLDPGLVPDAESWIGQMEVVLFPARVATLSLGVLGAMGAILSITGVFGMAAYSVSKRLKELGIRMALGAKRTQLLSTSLGRAFRILGIGSLAGLILGIAASRVLSAIVYQASPRDPLVLAGVVATMLLLGIVATWIPAQRALSLNPVTLLREE